MIDDELRTIGFDSVLAPDRWWRPTDNTLVRVVDGGLARWNKTNSEWEVTTIAALTPDQSRLL